MNAGSAVHSPTRGGSADRSRSSGASGFTLVEVVVALILLAWVVAVAFETMSASRRLSRKADETIEAARILQNFINNRAVIDEWLIEEKRPTEMTGEIVSEPGWRFAVHMTPLQWMADGDRDPIEVPSVTAMHLCVLHDTDQGARSFCVDRWFSTAERQGSMGASNRNTGEQSNREAGTPTQPLQ